MIVDREIAPPEDYAATFEGFKPGANVLEDLVARFHDRPIYVPGGIEAQRETDNVVVLDIPLLVENPREGLCGTVVVDLPVEIAVERLVTHRNMDRADAEARIARQATREARVAIADRIIDNSGDLASLETQVDEAWQWMRSLPPAAADAGRTTKS